jgi:hypothetical protein
VPGKKTAGPVNPEKKPAWAAASAEREQKRAERALKLAVRKLEKEGVKDYVIKVWRH